MANRQGVFVVKELGDIKLPSWSYSNVSTQQDAVLLGNIWSVDQL